MKRLVIFSLVLYLLNFGIVPVKADTQFEMYLNDFYTKQEQASKMLKAIEQELKDGSRDVSCDRQKQAAKYGIQATESLIKAFEINGSKTQLENLQSGLNKWKELRDYC